MGYKEGEREGREGLRAKGERRREERERACV